MGYLTYYTLVVIGNGEHEATVERREAIPCYMERGEKSVTNLRTSTSGAERPYEAVRARAGHALPLAGVPSGPFRPLGEGGEAEDQWKCYYLGGRMQEVWARTEHPPFDPTNSRTRGRSGMKDLLSAPEEHRGTSIRGHEQSRADTASRPGRMASASG